MAYDSFFIRVTGLFLSFVNRDRFELVSIIWHTTELQLFADSWFLWILEGWTCVWACKHVRCCSAGKPVICVLVFLREKALPAVGLQGQRRWCDLMSWTLLCCKSPFCHIIWENILHLLLYALSLAHVGLLLLQHLILYIWFLKMPSDKPQSTGVNLLHGVMGCAPGLWKLEQ